jgi:hypothetical protein
MNSSHQTKAVLVVALIALGASVFIVLRQYHAKCALESALAAAQAESAAAARLQEDLERLRGLEQEVQRLREENRELPRLRGDVTRLRWELTAASNRLAKASVARPVQSPPPQTDLTNLISFTGAARASLASGQTLVMGGWPMEAGKRTLALFTPHLDQAAGQPGQPGAVLLGGLYVQVPDSALTGPGWEQFQAAAQEASGSGVLDVEQAKKFVEALQKMDGVQILSAPRLMTTSGAAGTISIGEGNGVGLTTTLLPVLSADGLTVDLTVTNSLRQAPKPPGETPSP